MNNKIYGEWYITNLDPNDGFKSSEVARPLKNSLRNDWLPFCLYIYINKRGPQKVVQLVKIIPNKTNITNLNLNFSSCVNM